MEREKGRRGRGAWQSRKAEESTFFLFCRGLVLESEGCVNVCVQQEVGWVVGGGFACSSLLH